MEPNKEKILDRVVKLFALADSERNPSDEEVFAALSAAKKLMAEYDISEAEIKDREGKKEVIWKFGQSRAETSSINKIRMWQDYLSVGVCNITNTQGIKTKEEGIIFYGDEVDVGIASALFSILIKIAVKNGNKYLATQNKNSYLMGFTIGVQRQARKKVNLSKDQENKYAIVPTEKKDWIQKKVSELYPVTKEGGKTKVTVYNTDLYSEGVRDGMNIDLEFKNNLTGG